MHTKEEEEQQDSRPKQPAEQYLPLELCLQWKKRNGNPSVMLLANLREKEVFDEMWDIPRLYASACSNSCQLVPLHPIFS
jgi:hypothetical protein